MHIDVPTTKRDKRLLLRELSAELHRWVDDALEEVEWQPGGTYEYECADGGTWVVQSATARRDPGGERVSLDITAGPWTGIMSTLGRMSVARTWTIDGDLADVADVTWHRSGPTFGFEIPYVGDLVVASRGLTLREVLPNPRRPRPGAGW